MTLTLHQIAIMHYAARGKLNKEIAAELGVSVQNVKNNLSHIYKKLGASNRIEAVVRLYGTPRGETSLKVTLAAPTAMTLASGITP